MRKIAVVLLASAALALLAFPATATAGISIGRSIAVGADGEYNGDGKDVVRFGEDVEIPEDRVISGSLVVFGGDAVIAGTIEKDTVVFGGDVELKSTARVEGDLVNFGGKVTKAAGARIDGDEVDGPFFDRGFRFPSWVSTWFWFLQGTFVLIGTMALGALAVALFPEQTGRLAAASETEIWKSLGWGVLGMLAVPVGAIALSVTIIGIPFVILFFLALPLILLYGYVGVSRLLGRKVVASLNAASSSPVAEVLVGILILGLVGFVPVVGDIVRVIAVLIGLGAILVTKFGTGKPWRKAPQVSSSEAPVGQ
ncbi:MAG: bactofilin family protein [Candidatus Aquicultorales bacterium]